jgi:prepilin-type N-terminal cleavage/methylation domain-containing protein
MPRSPGSPSGHARVRGFTLIEVVIAIGILGVILSIGYSSMRNILRSKELLDDGRDVRLVTDAVLLRLVRELQLAYDKGLPRLPSCQEADPRPLPPTDTFLGEQGSLGPDDIRADSVTFLALEGGQYLPDGGGHSGVVQIRYFIAPTPPDDPSGGGPYTLVREEIPYLKPYKKACERAIIFPITNRIFGLEFSYYDGKNETWVDSWKAPNQDRNPSMVRFKVTFRSPAGKLSSFTTTVPLRAEIPL